MNFFHRTRPTQAARRHVVGTALSLMGGLFLQMGLTGSAVAQTAPYPNKSITMIVPFPPGGTTDVVTRLVAVELARSLGQSVVVDNKAGAGGRAGY